MASSILNANAEVEDGKIIEMLHRSWFSRARSTKEMRIGTKNEDAILLAFCSSDKVTDIFSCDIFSCGLLESKEISWLVACPDAVAIIKTPNGDKALASVEVNTRVLLTHIAKAERIA
jgi:hypothetical protein